MGTTFWNARAALAVGVVVCTGACTSLLGDFSIGGSSGPDATADAAGDSVSDDGGSDVIEQDGGIEAAVGQDGGGDTGAAVPAHAEIIFVNQAFNQNYPPPPMRFCFGITGADGGTPAVAATAYPVPNDDSPSALRGQPYPGVFVGCGAPLSPFSQDVSVSAVHVYALLATNIQSQVQSNPNELNCAQLIGPHGAGKSDTPPGTLTLWQDFYDVGTFPPGALRDGSAWLGVLHGCLSGLSGTQSYDCGAGASYNASTGNLTMLDLALDTQSSIQSGSIGAQFAEVPQFWYVGSVEAGFHVPTVGGQATLPVAVDAGYLAVVPPVLTDVSNVTTDGGSTFFAEAFDDGGFGGTTEQPLPAIEAMTWMPFGLDGGFAVPDGGALENGRGYVFVLVGTLGGHGPSDPLSAHFLAFPTDPAIAIH